MADMDGIDDIGARGARLTGAPSRRSGDKRTLPLGNNSSSGKRPLPGPLPGPVSEVAAPKLFPEVEDILTTSSVTPQNWLPKPDYWLADYQPIRRPPTRPVPRPQRFQPVSYGRSMMVMIVSLVCIMIVLSGMMVAGHITYDFFTAPFAAPASQPATATATETTLPATATDTALPATATTTGEATAEATGTASPELPTATP